MQKERQTAAVYTQAPALALLGKIRGICSDLPQAEETVSFGHPTFRTAGKTFAVFELYKGELGLAMKVEQDLQDVFLKDPRFYRTPYLGKHGWVTLRMIGDLNWKEIRELLRGSYALCARSAVSEKSRRVRRRSRPAD